MRPINNHKRGLAPIDQSEHPSIHPYGLYGLKHHITEMRGGVTDVGQTNKQTIEDLMLTYSQVEAGGQVSQQRLC